jgi:hypothetical protein
MFDELQHRFAIMLIQNVKNRHARKLGQCSKKGFKLGVKLPEKAHSTRELNSGYSTDETMWFI